MFNGDEVIDLEAEAMRKAAAMQNVIGYRDQLFDEGQWKAVKMIGGTILGMYIVYRFLFSK